MRPRTPISEEALASIFLDARTHYDWTPQQVPRSVLEQLYDVAKLGPTSANCSPMRVAFLLSVSAKDRLLPALSKGNIVKAAAAPVVAVIAWDRNYLDRVPELFPVGYDARSWFTKTPQDVGDHGLRNTMLQAAYLIIAARALGLDCGPMSGFDARAVNAEFFAESTWDAKLLINLGYGAKSEFGERGPRLRVEEAIRFL
jgi:3-hydroxypropanoate dehydrogenase